MAKHAGNRTGRQAKKRRARHQRRGRRGQVLAELSRRYPGARITLIGRKATVLLPGRVDNIKMTIGLAPRVN